MLINLMWEIKENKGGFLGFWFEQLSGKDATRKCTVGVENQ